MNVLLANTAQEEMKSPHAPNHQNLLRLISSLERLDLDLLQSSPNVHRVWEAEEEIYVLREGSLRAFFTRKGQDIVVLSITNG